MGFDFDKGERARDERLRRSLLELLYAARRTSPTGGLSGRMVAHTLAGGDTGVQDDGHAVGLLRDLAAVGLVTLTQAERRKGDRFGIDHLSARITAAGVQLVDRHVPPVPGVYDERLPAGGG